jgi:hypothetical protein
MGQSADLDRLLRYIDDLYDTWMRRPEAYASSPQSLEDTFLTLECLREFMLSDAPRPAPVADCAYVRFLANAYPDLGVSMFTARVLREGQSTEEHTESLFAGFVTCWRRFLSSAYRGQTGVRKRLVEGRPEKGGAGALIDKRNQLE